MRAYVSVEQMGEEDDEEELDCRVDPHVSSCHCNVTNDIMVLKSEHLANRVCVLTSGCHVIPMLVVVNEEKRPRIHEKGSDIASAAMPSWPTCQCHAQYRREKKNISKPYVC